jgi:hypothetical protein
MLLQVMTWQQVSWQATAAADIKLRLALLLCLCSWQCHCALGWPRPMMGSVFTGVVWLCVHCCSASWQAQVLCNEQHSNMCTALLAAALLAAALLAAALLAAALLAAALSCRSLHSTLFGSQDRPPRCQLVWHCCYCLIANMMMSLFGAADPCLDSGSWLSKLVVSLQRT